MNISSDLTKLTREDIVKLLEETGYLETSKDIVSARYKSNYDKGVCYQIEYDCGEKKSDFDNVFVFIDRGKIICDY